MTSLICHDFPSELHERLEQEADRHKVSVSFAVQCIIGSYFDEQDKPAAEFKSVGVYKSYACTKEQAEEAIAVFEAIAEAKKDELLGQEAEG